MTYIFLCFTLDYNNFTYKNIYEYRTLIRFLKNTQKVIFKQLEIDKR